jgi:hypothetical protein
MYDVSSFKLLIYDHALHQDLYTMTWQRSMIKLIDEFLRLITLYLHVVHILLV